jgi:hypothetical protein
MRARVAVAVILYIAAVAVPVGVLLVFYGPSARVDPKSAKDLLFLLGGGLFAFTVAHGANLLLRRDSGSESERLSSFP